jgi:hypothetical protein
MSYVNTDTINSNVNSPPPSTNTDRDSPKKPRKSKTTLWMQLTFCRAMYVGLGALVIMFAVRQSKPSDSDNKEHIKT